MTTNDEKKDLASQRLLRTSPGSVTVLIGPSHVGKTTVAAALVDGAGIDIEIHELDEFLYSVDAREVTLERVREAYALWREKSVESASRGMDVVAISTLTFVDRQGRCEFHGDQLTRLVAACSSREVPILVALLTTDTDLTHRRRADDRGISRRIIAAIQDRYATLDLQDVDVVVNVDHQSVAETASALRTAILHADSSIEP